MSFAEQFLCTAEKASGFVHEDDQWKAVSFNTDSKYLVDFDRGTVNRFDESVPIHSNCSKGQEYGRQLFDCRGDGEFMMSSDTMKYLITVPYLDYVLGEAGGTPHMEIGTCAKF
jgi:hypothetical protein